MRKSILDVGKWISVVLALVSSFWLIFWQLYTVQFLLIAYVLSELSRETKKHISNLRSSTVLVSIILSWVVTIYMGFSIEKGFQGGSGYTPGGATLILSVLDTLLMLLTIVLFARVIQKNNN